MWLLLEIITVLRVWSTHSPRFPWDKLCADLPLEVRVLQFLITCSSSRLVPCLLSLPSDSLFSALQPELFLWNAKLTGHCLVESSKAFLSRIKRKILQVATDAAGPGPSSLPPASLTSSPLFSSTAAPALWGSSNTPSMLPPQGLCTWTLNGPFFLTAFSLLRTFLYFLQGSWQMSLSPTTLTEEDPLLLPSPNYHFVAVIITNLL